MRVKQNLLLFLALLFFLPKDVKTLTISPALVEKEALPGATLQLSIKIFNEKDQAETFYPQTANFEASSDGATPQFLGDNDPAEAAAWFTLSRAQVEVASGQTLEIPFKINVPKNAAPGGHYAALFWSDARPGERGIGTASRVGTLFLLKVKGDVQERGVIKNFSSDIGPNGLVNFTLTFANLGNVHLRPVGQIKIYDYFDHLVYQTYLNSTRQAVLPGSERAFSAELADNKFYLGPFRAVATITYGQSKNILTADYKFWLGLNYIKWLVVIAALIVILIIRRRKL